MTESQASHIIAAFIRDRAYHYDDAFELAQAVDGGEAFEAFRDGELDDLIDHATVVSMQKGATNE